MKESVFKFKEEKGITIIALVITVLVLLVLASISIAILTGNGGIIQTSSDSQIETELSELQERINSYKVQEEAGRIGEGDYSGEMSNLDLVDRDILKTVQVKNPEMTVGIIDLEKLGIKTNLGNNYKNIDVTEIENLSDLQDVFVLYKR